MTRRSSCGNSDGCTSRRMWRRTTRTGPCDRPTDYPAYRLRTEPAETKASGAVVRMDEGHRNAEEGEVARAGESRVAVYLHRCGVQSLPAEKSPSAGGRVMRRPGTAVVRQSRALQHLKLPPETTFRLLSH